MPGAIFVSGNLPEREELNKLYGKTYLIGFKEMSLDLLGSLMVYPPVISQFAIENGWMDIWFDIVDLPVVNFHMPYAIVGLPEGIYIYIPSQN